MSYVPIISAMQSVSISFLDNVSSGTATITAVDTTRTIIIPCGSTTNTNSAPSNWNWSNLPFDQNVLWTLTNATTVTVSVPNPPNQGFTYVCNAIVYSFPKGSLKQGIQRGSITIAQGSTSNTATVTAVGAKGFVIPSGGAFNSSLGLDTSFTAYDAFVRLSMTSATVVTLQRANASNSTGTAIIGAYQVIDPF